MPRLVGHSPEILGKIYELSEAVVSIGRTANNAVHLPDNSVSSRHAELRLDGLDYMVKDLDSTNGTRVNGEKITTSILRRGDIIRFGNIDVMYESEHEPITVPLPPRAEGVSLEGCASHGRPAHFSASGNAGKPQKTEDRKWNYIVIGTGVLALLSVGYFIFRLVTIG